MNWKDDIIIRAAEEKDFASADTLMQQVHKIHTDARPDIYKPNGNIISRTRFSQLAGKGSVIVAVFNGQIVGMAVFFVKHQGSPNHVQRTVMILDSVVVDEKYRGKGIGRLLAERVEEEGRRQGCSATELSVCAFNSEARKAYGYMGYKEKSIIMEKPQPCHISQKK